MQPINVQRAMLYPAFRYIRSTRICAARRLVEGDWARCDLLMVDKLTLQLLRARRAQYARSSEQLDDPQIALIEGTTV